MITLLPDFTEEERIYWKNIEEILDYKEIIKHYDKLLLIRLKSFIEGQINSREFQCFLFLEKISHKETFASWEYQEENIKIKLGNIKLNGTQFTNYLNSSEIERVNELIQYLLKVSHQYCCNYRTLKIILDLIFEELNKDDSKAVNIPIVAKEEEEEEEEVSSPADLLKMNTVKIDSNVIIEVYDDLKEYFAPEKSSNLKACLEGKNISEKLMFKGNKNQLTELFKRIEYNSFFTSSPNKTNIAYWIVNNFTTLKGNFNYNQVYKEELSKTEFSIPRNKRICNSIKSLQENLLKQKNTDNRK